MDSQSTTHHLSLSHEEVLAALGLLRLPLPLGLGEHPTAGYTEDTLNIALTVAMGGLLARGLVARQGDDFSLAPEAATALTVASLADSCLLLNGDAQQQNTTAYYYFQGPRVLAHSSPIERVHRLAWTSGVAAVIAESLSQIIPHSAADVGAAFEIDATALSIAIEALSAGQSHSASSILRQAGTAQSAIDAFTGSLGTKPARYAFMAIRNLRTPQPDMESIVVVQGMAATWCARPTAAPSRAGEVLRVAPVGSAELEQQLTDMLQALAV